VTASSAVIAVTITGTGVTGLDTKKLQLEPTSDAGRTTLIGTATTPIAGWSCGTDAAANMYKFFPASCRQTLGGGL
jgi:type IV pilus assembly protein PilA